MSQASVDFLNLFVRPPGELLYFFTIISISLASLFMVLGQRMRRPDDMVARRYTWVLLGVVIAWITLMAGALLSLLSDIEAIAVLPPLERFASVVSILLLAWAFLTAGRRESTETPSLLMSILLSLAIIGYIFTAVQWAQLAGDVDFNLSVLGATWTFITALISMICFLLVLSNFSRVIDAPLKLVFFALVFSGYAWTLLQIVEGNIIGNYAGAIRIAFVAALSIVPALAYRSIIARFEDEMTHAVTQLEMLASQPSVQEPPRPSVSPVERESVQLLRALGLILENATASTVPERIMQAVLDVLKVDMVALLRLQDANYADVEIAYDNVMNRRIDGIAINLDNQPALVNCIERRVQRSLQVEDNSDELQDLFTRLDIDQVGPVYFQPMNRDNELVAVLMVGQPYSKRPLVGADEELLKGIGVIASSLLALSYAAQEATLLAEERTIQAMVQGVVPIDLANDDAIAARKELQTNLRMAREQINELSRQVVQLKLELDDERSRVARDLGDTEEGLSISQQMLAISDEQQQLREERDRLQEQLQEAQAALQGALPTTDESLYQEMIVTLRREKDELENERQRLQLQLGELRKGDRGPLLGDIQGVMGQMADEKSRLEVERDQLSARLEEIQSQLKIAGIEQGAAGIAQVISQLIEQRSDLQTENTRLQQERDRLNQEFIQFRERIAHEDERSAQFQALQNQLKNLAGDREAIIKQRDKLRAERDDLKEKLDIIKQHRTRLMAQAAGYDIELKEAHQEQAQLREQIRQLSDERSHLMLERDRLVAERQAIETERDLLIARTEGDRNRLQELGANGVGSLTGMIDELTQERSDLQQELHTTSMRLAEVENELEALKVRTSHQQVNATYKPDNPDLLIGLVEELRTPMTSISGYVDLLIGESAGILGEMQRTFLQRVSTNVTRLSSMLDDLIHVTALDTGKYTLRPRQVNIVNLIEDAITNASNQFREKGLAINLNLSDDVPSIEADPDALGQIVGQLLTNAYLVSPPSSEVSVTVRNDKLPYDTMAVDAVFVSIEDRGGGISPEDEGRVFARKYKAENPLILGLGDTGVGLSVAKALVQAHGGRLWLDTKDGVGSVFSFVLPVKRLEVTDAS